MEVRPNILVSLGYGKYVRSDKVVGLEPIEEQKNRGPGRRTRIYVEGRQEPVIGSRSEGTVLRDMVGEPKELLEARRALELVEDILQDLTEVGPMLRRSIKEEASFDIDSTIRRIRGIIDRESED